MPDTARGMTGRTEREQYRSRTQGGVSLIPTLGKTATTRLVVVVVLAWRFWVVLAGLVVCRRADSQRQGMEESTGALFRCSLSSPGKGMAGVSCYWNRQKAFGFLKA